MSVSRRAWLGGALAVLAGPLAAQPVLRVVSLGGAITEIVYALDAGGTLVGVDQSSIYPEAAKRLPQVGYYRSFSVEGVASLKPDVVLVADQAGPPHSLEQLRSLGLRLVVLPSAPTVEALARRIEGVAEALGRRAPGRALLEKIRAEVAGVGVAAKAVPKRVLMLSSHTGRMQAAGAETAGDAMVRLAGATNVFAAHKSYKPIAAEAVSALQPDVIVTTTSSVEAAGGLAAFAAQPGIAITPAARAQRIIVMDDLLLLSFGPRLPQALAQLRAGLARP